jgi:hypothetical protein
MADKVTFNAPDNRWADTGSLMADIAMKRYLALEEAKLERERELLRHERDLQKINLQGDLNTNLALIQTGHLIPVAEGTPGAVEMDVGGKSLWFGINPKKAKVVLSEKEMLARNKDAREEGQKAVDDALNNFDEPPTADQLTAIRKQAEAEYYFQNVPPKQFPRTHLNYLPINKYIVAKTSESFSTYDPDFSVVETDDGKQVYGTKEQISKDLQKAGYRPEQVKTLSGAQHSYTYKLDEENKNIQGPEAFGMAIPAAAKTVGEFTAGLFPASVAAVQSFARGLTGGPKSPIPQPTLPMSPIEAYRASVPEETEWVDIGGKIAKDSNLIKNFSRYFPKEYFTEYTPKQQKTARGHYGLTPENVEALRVLSQYGDINKGTE